MTSSCETALKNTLSGIICRHNKKQCILFLNRLKSIGSTCTKPQHICAHFCYTMVHYGILAWCIVGFVRWVCYIWRSVFESTNRSRIYIYICINVIAMIITHVILLSWMHVLDDLYIYIYICHSNDNNPRNLTLLDACPRWFVYIYIYTNVIAMIITHVILLSWMHVLDDLYIYIYIYKCHSNDYNPRNLTLLDACPRWFVST